MSAVPSAIATSSCIGREVHFAGEFGNQLFQIAVVLGYAEAHGFLPVFPPWKCVFSGRDYGALFPALDYRDDIATRHLFEQSGFPHEVIPRLDDCDLRGMFQSEKFFPRDKAALRRIFAAPAAIAALVDQIIAEKNLGVFSALHLRYYDRPGQDATPVTYTLPDHYNLKALEKLDPETPLVLVTNHAARAWLFARQHLAHLRPVIQCHADPLVDFYLLTRASHLAIGNSSFGWWAGYLNETAPTVYGPTRRKWFSFVARDEPYWATDDLYSSRFTELSF